MINLLPTPKNYAIKDNAFHKLPTTLYNEVTEWDDVVEAFCESFFKVFETDISIGQIGGIEPHGIHMLQTHILKIGIIIARIPQVQSPMDMTHRIQE